MGRGFQSSEEQIDASIGLVVRLNYLWSEADRKALLGEFDSWNFVLDRIYCNLMYRNPIEADLESDGKTIKDLKLNEESAVIYDKFLEKIKKAKLDLKNAARRNNRQEYYKCKEEYYRVLMLKDVWLRKFMQELRLYLKEFEFDPSRAMFGGIGK